GNVDDRWRVRAGFEHEAKIAAVIERVGDFDVEVAGITLIAVRTGQRQDEPGDRTTFNPLNLPNALVEALCTTVQRVCPVITAQCMALAVELESRARDAVGIAAYSHPEVDGLLLVTRQVIVADRNVGRRAVAIGRDQ